MCGITEFIIVIAVACSLLAYQARGYVWLAVSLAYLLTWTFVRDGAVLPLLVGWLGVGFLALCALYPPFRRQMIAAPIYRRFQALLPPMSQTERDALEAGTVWWDRELFSGRPDWRRLLDIPRPQRTDEEQAFLDGPVESLCGMLNDWQITHEDKDLSPEVWDYIKANGFFGMIIPKQYGGLDFSAQAHSDVVMKIASRSITAAVTVMVPNSLGPAKLLLHYGTEAQKDHYLPRLARGEEVPCFALTGPEAGSDAASIPDRGVVTEDMFEGKRVLGIRLNWEKRYITLGPVATILGLAFRLYDPDHLLGDRDDLGITLALIPTTTPGIEIGHRHYPLNLAFQNGPNRGHDVFIPLEWVIGERDGIGHGWRMLMECLADGRSISLPALSTGAGKMASRLTGAYAAIRKQFKTPIGRFDGVAEALGRIAGNTYLMDAARELTCTALDMDEKPSVISAIVKYHLTERMRETINHAMDIHGGSGICLGPRNILGRVYQALPISITVEGANILTRSLIIFGQGALRCHPYVLKEIQAAQDTDPERGLLAFDRTLFAHTRWLLANTVRTFWYGITGGRLQWFRLPRDDMRAAYRCFTRLSAVFAFVADIAMLSLGGSLKRRERLSARLGDVLSYLYLGSAVLKRYHDQGQPAEDCPLVEWAWRECAYQIQTSLLALLSNFPNRLLARALQLWVFPLGRSFSPPSDALTDQVCRIILQPGAPRDRLTAGLFIPESSADPLGRLEDALTKTVRAEVVLRRIRRAMRQEVLAKGDPELRVAEAVAAEVITEAEAEWVREAILARRDVITVDEFTPAAIRGEQPQWQTRVKTG